MSAPEVVVSERQGLKARVLSGSVWTIVGFGSSKVIQLGSNLILTRLLYPEAFGLMALVNVFITGMQMLSDVGVKPAIIQMSKGTDETFLNTAWTIQVLRGVALSAILAALAQPISMLYDEPRLVGLLAFTGLSATISGFKAIGVHLADRAMMVRRSISMKLISQCVSVGAMISLALVIDSVWALAIGTILGAIAEVITGHIIMPKHRHRPVLDRQSVRELFAFGKWILPSTVLSYFGGQGIRAIEGTLVPIAVVGFISIAATMSWAMQELSSQLMTRIVFPSLAVYNREAPEEFRRIFAKLRLRLLGLAVPAFAVLALGSNFIIGLLYEPRYAMAGPILALLAVNGALSNLPLAYEKAFLALGQTHVQFWITGTTTAVRGLSMMVGFQLGGLFAMMIGVGIGNLIVFALTAFLAQRRGWWLWKQDACAIVLTLIAGYFAYVLNVEPWVHLSGVP